MADLPGHYVGINSMCTTKLEHFDENGTRANIIRKLIFRDGLTVFGRNNYLLTKLECRIFRETMVDLF